jgi:hypothetical protein
MPRGRPKKKTKLKKEPVSSKTTKEKKKVGRPKKHLETNETYLTKEQMEARAERIRKDLPKYDPFKPRIVVDLAKDPEECKKTTQFACFRPDVYLDYGCEFCSLYKHCACPIKDGVNKKSRKNF